MTQRLLPRGRRQQQCMRTVHRSRVSITPPLLLLLLLLPSSVLVLFPALGQSALRRSSLNLRGGARNLPRRPSPAGASQPSIPNRWDVPVGGGSNNASAGVLAVLSKFGLQYAKDVLVTQVLQELVPLAVPDMNLDLSTLVGQVSVNLTSLVLWNATVPTSKLYLDERDQSITVYAGDINATMTAGWSFDLGHYFWDHGNATVTVRGLHVVVVGNLSEREGSLFVEVDEVQCVIERVQISLHSAYSWIYNWLEARLPNHLREAVQSEVEWSVGTIVDELNDFLQGLPRVFPVDCTSNLNVTVPDDPHIEQEAVLLECSGDFIQTQGNCSSHRHRHSWPWLLESRAQEGAGESVLVLESVQQDPVVWQSVQEDHSRTGLGPEQQGSDRDSDLQDRGGGRSQRHGLGGSCEEASKMLTLSVAQGVVDSAVEVYYNSGALSFTLQQLPGSFPFQLNTRSWRFVLPALFRQYPDRDMELAVGPTSLPRVAVTRALGVAVAAQAEFFLRVLLEEGPKDVLCVDIAMEMSAVASLSGNNLTVVAKLSTISVDICWSTVGTIPHAILESITWTLTRVAMMPLINYRLGIGFPLPSIPGVQFSNSTVVYQDSALQVCTDLVYTGGIIKKHSSPERWKYYAS